MKYIDQIINYLMEEKISTTEVADALGKKGAVPNIMPLNRGLYRVGRIKWVYALDESNWSVHNQIRKINDDQVIFIDSFQCGDRAIIGELVCKYLLVHHKSRAVIIRGKVRDAGSIIQKGWPVWCTGCSPVGCFKEKPEEDLNETIKMECRKSYDEGIAVCDDGGVVVIPKDKMDLDFLNALHDIHEQEDIWFDRLDNYKKNTYDIVCRKEYLLDKEYMEMRKKSRK